MKRECTRYVRSAEYTDDVTKIDSWANCYVVVLYLLISCIFSMLNRVETAGLSTVEGGYGSVVLHNGGSVYVFVGVVAFVTGVTITVLCIKLRKKK